jgi:hypothetical protein
LIRSLFSGEYAEFFTHPIPKMGIFSGIILTLKFGWDGKEDLSSTYTEWNIWNRQGGSTDNLALTLNPQGFQNIHDWRLRIKDSAGGDQGYLEEYVIQIG